MKKYFVVGLLVVSFILTPVFANAQTNQPVNSCIQDCLGTYGKVCVGTGLKGVTPFCLTKDEVSTKCQLICGESATAVLNSNYPMNIGQRVVIKDYDKMEMTLLQIKSKCIGEKELLAFWDKDKDKNVPLKTVKSCTKLEDVTAVLRLKKNNEETFLEIKDKGSNEAFGVRVDFVTYITNGYPVNQNEKTGEWEGGGSSQPFAGVFGVYEKGASGFWARIANWLKRLF